MFGNFQTVKTIKTTICCSQNLVCSENLNCEKRSQQEEGGWEGGEGEGEGREERGRGGRRGGSPFYLVKTKNTVSVCSILNI